MRIKRIAAIHDLSGIGRCSLTVALPVLSALGVQAVPIPTAVLSAHTGYKDVTFLDLSENMSRMFGKYIAQNEAFDAIYTGFLGSAGQAGLLEKVFDAFPGALKIVDPVMGDDGELYSTITPELCRELAGLAAKADVITPNLTEACLLLEKDYCKNPPSDSQVGALLEGLAALGPEFVVITGIRRGDKIVTASLRRGGAPHFHDGRLLCPCYPGTGDLFASVLAGCLVRGADFAGAADLACDFVAKCVGYSAGLGAPVLEGAVFEPLLNTLFELAEKLGGSVC